MSTPINHPARPGFREVTWTPVSVVARSESIFTLQAQVYRWAGQKRLATLKLPSMTATDAMEWRAFFASLNGREGTFYLGDKVAAEQALPRKGAGAVDGSGQTGGTIATGGWAANRAQLFRAGEVVSIADRLYDVLEAASSDAAGAATLRVWPQIATAPADGATVEWVAPRGVFRVLESPSVTWNVAKISEGLSFSVEEAL